MRLKFQHRFRYIPYPARADGKEWKLIQRSREASMPRPGPSKTLSNNDDCLYDYQKECQEVGASSTNGTV
jgi:hypothetical protein